MGQAEQVRLLLQHVADVDSPAIVGITPLNIAIHWQCHEIIAMLLAAGAKLDAPKKRGETPLHFAARYGDQKTYSTILDHARGPAIQSSLKNTFGKSPIVVFDDTHALESRPDTEDTQTQRRRLQRMLAKLCS